MCIHIHYCSLEFNESFCLPLIKRHKCTGLGYNVARWSVILNHLTSWFFICLYGLNLPGFSVMGNIKSFTAIVSGSFNKKHLCTFKSCTCANIKAIITGPSKGANAPSRHSTYCMLKPPVHECINGVFKLLLWNKASFIIVSEKNHRMCHPGNKRLRVVLRTELPEPHLQHMHVTACKQDTHKKTPCIVAKKKHEIKPSFLLMFLYWKINLVGQLLVVLLHHHGLTQTFKKLLYGIFKGFVCSAVVSVICYIPCLNVACGNYWASFLARVCLYKRHPLPPPFILVK